MKKILVINGKGGVGKTTASIELFSTFLYLRNNYQKTTLYSFDEENFLSSYYEHSDVLKIKAKKVNGVEMEEDITSILLKDRPMVVDVGANKTTTYMLKALENTGLYQTFDLIAIPITDGEQDTLNAKSIYTSIRRMSKEIPIIFVLSRYVEGRDIHIQFDAFFEILFPFVDNKDRRYVVLNDSDAIKYGKKLSKTIYEVSLKKKDFDTEFKEALQNKQSEAELLEITRKRRVYKLAKEYRVNILNSAYEELDKINREIG